MAALSSASRREAIVSFLNANVSALEDDAVEVLAFIAQRLVHGRRIHGDMDLSHDDRNYELEALEEDADGLVYRAAESVRQMRRARERQVETLASKVTRR